MNKRNNGINTGCKPIVMDFSAALEARDDNSMVEDSRSLYLSAPFSTYQLEKVIPESSASSAFCFIWIVCRCSLIMLNKYLWGVCHVHGLVRQKQMYSKVLPRYALVSFISNTIQPLGLLKILSELLLKRHTAQNWEWEHFNRLKGQEPTDSLMN